MWKQYHSRGLETIAAEELTVEQMEEEFSARLLIELDAVLADILRFTR